MPVYRAMVWNFFFSVLPLGVLLGVIAATGLVDLATTRAAASRSSASPTRSSWG
ncbi:hypothetical protein [Nocardia tengchongensis]